jgi:uncharacterized protein YndB with AHSA1/START domain
MSSFLLLLFIALAGFLYLVSQKPDTFRLQRSAVVKASPETVFAQLNDLHRWNDWSPWARKDPAMKQSYSGPQSGVGSGQAWDGNRNVGAGSMTIIESVPNKKVRYRLDFEKPIAAHNLAEINLQPDNAGTRVTWTMEGPVPFPSKIMHTLFDMDKLIGNDFEAGLANLKGIVEQHRAS